MKYMIAVSAMALAGLGMAGIANAAPSGPASASQTVAPGAGSSIVTTHSVDVGLGLN
jgi:hypothetical protein